MNSLEVKFILEACRAGDLDPDDPKIAEAIRAMDADPALGDWWAANQEFDRAVARKLMAAARSAKGAQGDQAQTKFSAALSVTGLPVQMLYTSPDLAFCSNCK